MKYVVKVADQSYVVEIEDIYARPVIARVNGQEFRVNPEDAARLTPQNESQELQSVPMPKQVITSGTSSREMTAPLPGTVVEIFARPGDTIEAGQVILIIEAMKMKNSIRSRRAGKIASVCVRAGETVAHKQVLVEFAE
jgi:oxaloacetate decarboxylase alpha subunit